MKKEFNHLINVSFHTGVERSPRVIEIGEAFGLGLGDQTFNVYNDLKLTTRQGDCIYITGQSGSGKSIMLRELTKSFRDEHGLKVGVIDEITLEEKPIIDQVGETTEEACKLLSKAGLNDAYLFIRKPSELSDGQRYRFKIAKLLASGADVIAADEFGAVLDRTTAKTVAYSIRKLCEANNVTFIVATTHKDLYWDLRPTLVIDKRYSDVIDIRKTPGDMLETY